MKINYQGTSENKFFYFIATHDIFETISSIIIFSLYKPRNFSVNSNIVISQFTFRLLPDDF